MRSVVSAMVGLLLAGCGPASVGEYPDTDSGIPLPDRTPGSGDAGTPGDTDAGNTATPTTVTLTVNLVGTGTVTSTPTGLTCTGATCTGTFPTGTAVTLANAPAAGAFFTAWSGGCTGVGACAPVLAADTTVGAAFESLAGTWSGTYTNARPANGCNFTNAGNLSAAITTTTTSASTASITGLELRQSGSCALVGMTTGSAPSSAVTLAGNKLTGTWTFNVSGASGSLAFPFTGTLDGKKLTGSWTCTGCTGSFSLTKP